MQRSIIRRAVAVAAAVALSTLGAAGASASGPAATAVARAPAVGTARAVAVPGTQLWVKRYTSRGGFDDEATSLAVSPTGDTVFITGHSEGPYSDTDYATITYNAASGAQLWAQRYDGPGGRYNSHDGASSVAVGPSGATVFVTGTSTGATSGADYVTIAYNAATGARLWLQRYNGPGNGSDGAASVAVSPEGSTVFVTGTSTGAATREDYTTIAYNAATGARQWLQRYNGLRNHRDYASSMVISPDGATLFVTGTSTGTAATGEDYATVAYNAATGARQWVKRYNGPASLDEQPTSIAVSPAGDMVFVTGQSKGATSYYDYATVAYNAATGTQQWAQRYSGPGVDNDSFDGASSVAISPAGDMVFVTGQSHKTASYYGYATIAYNATTGTQLWAQRYNGPRDGLGGASSVGVSPSAGTVFVTGCSPGTTSAEDYATIAYNAVTGARLWLQPYNGPANNDDYASSVAVSPTGDKLFVTGWSWGATSGNDYATIAYSG